MTNYCRINDNIVEEFLEWEGDIYTVMNKELIWVEATDTSVMGGSYIDGVFGPIPALSNDQLIANAQNFSFQMLLKVAPVITSLQDQSDLGNISDSDATKLKALKQYRVDIGNISTQKNYPSSITWPVSPI